MHQLWNCWLRRLANRVSRHTPFFSAYEKPAAPQEKYTFIRAHVNSLCISEGELCSLKLDRRMVAIVRLPLHRDFTVCAWTLTGTNCLWVVCTFPFSGVVVQQRCHKVSPRATNLPLSPLLRFVMAMKGVYVCRQIGNWAKFLLQIKSQLDFQLYWLV
jgi:hypothetical protein